MYPTRLRVVVLLAACVAGCDKEYPNPFQNPNPTATPRPDAVLLVTSDVWSASPGAPRELYAVGPAGAEPQRLTFCNAAASACDNVEAAVGQDPTRVAILRIGDDSDGDGRLTPADGANVVYVDLDRNVEGPLLPPGSGVSGVDWSPADDLLVFSGQRLGEPDDLFRVDVNGQNNRQLTSSPTVGERRPRIDPSGSVAVFERTLEGSPGEVWIFGSTTSQSRVTSGGTPGEALPGTVYRVGSDADPDYAPDGRTIVFRRLTAPGAGGRGLWDLMVVAPDGTGLAVIAGGPRYRGAPDWGPGGIVFEEVDEEGRASLVVLPPDGGGRTTLATVGPGYTLSQPRWLP